MDRRGEGWTRRRGQGDGVCVYVCGGSCWVVLAPGQRRVFIHPAPNHDGGGRPGEEQP